ncbi:hypothetical protein ACIBF1_44380 [Spirillospora sp. NPDC050679]
MMNKTLRFCHLVWTNRFPIQGLLCPFVIDVTRFPADERGRNGS